MTRILRNVSLKTIGHFRAAVNLIMKARLSIKLSIQKLVLFAYE